MENKNKEYVKKLEKSMCVYEDALKGIVLKALSREESITFAKNALEKIEKLWN